MGPKFDRVNKNLGQKCYRVRKKIGQKLYWVKKKMGQKFYRVKTIWVGNFIGLKKLGRKFGLAKFLFGLIRFVGDLLLITSKLNINNTEFHWVGGGLKYP